MNVFKKNSTPDIYGLNAVLNSAIGFAQAMVQYQIENKRITNREAQTKMCNSAAARTARRIIHNRTGKQPEELLIIKKK